MAVRPTTALGRQSTHLWHRYIHPVIPLLLGLYVPILLLLATTRWVLGARAPDIVEPLSLDLGRAPGHSSFVVLELALWACATVSAALGVRHAVMRRSDRWIRFFGAAALISVLFFADDMFQLHKPVVPDATGLPSGLILAVYAGIVVTWLVVCRREIAETEAGILAAALGFFALWGFYKLGLGLPWETPVEVSSKLCGVAGWALYFVRTGHQFPASRHEA